MHWYKAKLVTESWLASAWQADTIWGHLCWGLRHMEGEKALLQFIESYEQGTPPLLLSNGFPDDLLPRPVLPEPDIDKSLSLKEQRQKFRDRKEAKGIRWLTEKEFTRALAGEQFIPSDKRDTEIRLVTLKNQINRLTGTTGAEGQLFNFTQYRWQSVAIYLKVADTFVAKAKELFHYLAQAGYGKRKSVGYGQIRLERFEPFPGFPAPANPNGFLSLSDFVPSAKDPVSGYWSILVKYGKLGEELAVAGNPFKKPLVMFMAGSCFYDLPIREYYGRLVRGLSPAHDGVVQYGLALPIPMKLPTNRESPKAAGEVEKR